MINIRYIIDLFKHITIQGLFATILYLSFVGTIVLWTFYPIAALVGLVTILGFIAAIYVLKRLWYISKAVINNIFTNPQ